MRISDSTDGYGLISVSLHWIVFALVVFLFISGQVLEDVSPATEDGRALRLIHSSVGVLGSFFLIGRIVWRWFQGSLPDKDEGPRSLVLLSKLVQWGLLIAIVTLVVTGPLQIWSGGRPLAIFDWFVIASPMPRVEWLHEGLEEIHEIAANAMLPLVALHVLGAIKHLVIDRDRVFQRMFRSA